MSAATAALEFRHVDILFPARQGGSGQRERMRRALELLDSGQARMQIAESTGIVVGVADANLSVAPGEISVLMGLSGSGKSTLLRAANGLNVVTRGQVLVGGNEDSDEVVDVAACDRAQLRRVRRERIAMVFQQFGLLPWRTVRENVGLGLALQSRSGTGSSMRSWHWSVSPTGPAVMRANCPAACSSVWAWRAHSPPRPIFC